MVCVEGFNGEAWLRGCAVRILSVVGARPNFMKIAPFVKALKRCNAAAAQEGPVNHFLVHTGQHYDREMSAAFFDDLGIPRPDSDLGVGSGTHAEQVGLTMIAFERVIQEYRPDWVVVVGDVNATCACSITAKKEHIKLAHIEAGLRSLDLDMPEEINRMVTDRLSDLLFTPDSLADGNLRREGVPEGRIHCVGNIMIDTLSEHLGQAKVLDMRKVLEVNRHGESRKTCTHEIASGNYAAVTLHRPTNVDDAEALSRLAKFLMDEVAAEMAVVWPIHPRTEKRLEDLGLLGEMNRIQKMVLLKPLGYVEMLNLNLNARIMLTDSGGLQEECCVLGTPCLTLRANTERPVTLEEFGGTCALVGNDIIKVRETFHRKKGESRRPFSPPLWDGKTADRIVRVMLQ